MSRPCRKCGGTERNARGYCPPCRAAYDKAFRKRPERREYNKRYSKKYGARPDVLEKRRLRSQLPEVKEYKQQWAARPEVAERNRIRDRQNRLGITPEAQAQLLVAQGGCCAICGDVLVAKKRTHLDHDPVTNRVRGFLCAGCNMALGLMKDSAERLRKAASYLEHHARSAEVST